MKILSVLVVCLALLLAYGAAWGQVPKTITYQGVLMDDEGKIVADGNYSITFNIYDVASGGTALWTENQNVVVTGGVFEAILGSQTAMNLPFDKPYWLGVKVQADPELVPRRALTASAYSLNAQSVAGGSNVFPSEGNVGIGTSNPQSALEVKGTIHSTQGGVRFPDGSVQSSAVIGGGIVPIGAVIDWWRPDDTWPVPDGFAICDGSTVNDAGSPLNGETLPNLTNLFIRGVTDANNIGQTGGSTSHSHSVDISHNHPSHSTSTAGSHTHSVDPPSYSASVNTSSAGSHLHRWCYFNGSNKRWYSYNSAGSEIGLRDWGDGLDADGSGIYPFETGGESTVYMYTMNAGAHTHSVSLSHDHPAFTSGSSGSHSHTLDLQNFTATKTSSSSSNVPPYYGLLKIMRIK